MSTPAPAKKPDLSAKSHPYRVMQGGQVIGQFSNLPLAEETACEYRGVVVVFERGEWQPC
jgi:hypothetical protein